MESLCNIAFRDGVSPQSMSAFNDGVVTFLLFIDQQYSSTKLEVYTPGGRMDVPLEDFSKTVQFTVSHIFSVRQFIYRKASIKASIK